jgi:uncharacterized protein (UPF0297 family)
MYSKRKKIHQFIVNIFLVAPEKGKEIIRNVTGYYLSGRKEIGKLFLRYKKRESGRF